MFLNERPSLCYYLECLPRFPNLLPEAGPPAKLWRAAFRAQEPGLALTPAGASQAGPLSQAELALKPTHPPGALLWSLDSVRPP